MATKGEVENGGRHPKEHPFPYFVTYASCMPVSNGKSLKSCSHEAHFYKLCCDASKGHGIGSLGDNTITAAAAWAAALQMSVKQAVHHLFTSKNKREEQSSYYKVLCWVADPLQGERERSCGSREAKGLGWGGHLPSWRKPPGLEAWMSAVISGALCSLLISYL